MRAHQGLGLDGQKEPNAPLAILGPPILVAPTNPERVIQQALTHASPSCSPPASDTNLSEEPIPDNSAEVLFSTHVFQHFDHRDDALRVFQEGYRILAPGGTLMIHLPLVHLPSFGGAAVLRQLLWAMEWLKALKAAVRRRSAIS